MTKRAEKISGGTWATGAFPAEASMNYDEVAVEDVRKRVSATEKELSKEQWEVVDGFSFPYAQYA